MNESMMLLEEFNKLSKEDQYNTLVTYMDKYGKKEIKTTWGVSAQWINNLLYPLDKTVTKSKTTNSKSSKKQTKSKNKRKTSPKKETKLNADIIKYTLKNELVEEDSPKVETLIKELVKEDFPKVETLTKETELNAESIKDETLKNVHIENCGFEIQLNGLMSACEVQERLNKIADTLLSSKEYSIILNLKELKKES
jgi:hypothetical protein